MGAKQPGANGESEYPTLRWLQRTVLLVFGVLFVGGFLFIGLTPEGWDAGAGVFLAFVAGYFFFEDELARYLTELQEWMLFALFGTVCVTAVVVLDGELSDELVVGYVGCLAVSGLFGYRAWLGHRARNGS